MGWQQAAPDSDPRLTIVPDARLSFVGNDRCETPGTSALRGRGRFGCGYSFVAAFACASLTDEPSTIESDESRITESSTVKPVSTSTLLP